MKELKSSVGLGGKPGEGGEEVCQDDHDHDHDGDDDDDDGDNDEEEVYGDDSDDDCCYRWQVQQLDLILNL